MLYAFRIEANLLDATVCVAKSKALASKVIGQNYFKPCDIDTTRKAHVSVMSCYDYEDMTGIKNNFPAPKEIIEIGIVKRYKVK